MIGFVMTTNLSQLKIAQLPSKNKRTLLNSFFSSSIQPQHTVHAIYNVLWSSVNERFASHKGTANLMNMRETASVRVKHNAK